MSPREPREQERAGGGRSVAWMMLATAGAAALLLGAGGVIVALNAPEPPPANAPSAPSAPEPHGPPEPAPAVVAQHEATDLRKLAKLDCNAEKWSDCEGKLEQASTLDPEGNLARSVQRMRRKVARAGMWEASEGDGGSARHGRQLDAPARAEVAAVLRGDGGGGAVRAQLECAGGAEPTHLCDQLAAALKKAGWTVTRAQLPADAQAVPGERIEVGTDADDTAQAAADLLADALTTHGIVPRGPDDMTPEPGSPPLRITIGVH